MRDMQTVHFYPDENRPALLHIETPGGIINLRVGLSDAEGREVVAVEILPDDETRGGDGTGRIWHLAEDGRRLVCQTPTEPDTASTSAEDDAEDDAEEDRVGETRGSWSLVTTAEADDDDLDYIAEQVRTGDLRGYLHHRP